MTRQVNELLALRATYWMGKNDDDDDDGEDGPSLMALKAKAVTVQKKAGAKGRVDDHLGGTRKPDLTAIGLDIAKSL